MVRRMPTFRFRKGDQIKRLIRTPQTGLGVIPGAKLAPIGPTVSIGHTASILFYPDFAPESARKEDDAPITRLL
jgi:hypothetical protein